MATAEEILDDKDRPVRRQGSTPSEWDLPALKRELSQLFALDDADYRAIEFDQLNAGELRDALWERIEAKYSEKEQIVPRDILRRVERDLMLQIVDEQWKDHLYSLDHLKEGIGLRGYGQRDPLVEYKKESFQLFQDMRSRIEEEIVRYLWWLRPVVEGGDDGPARARPPPAARRPALSYNDPSEESTSVFAPSRRRPRRRLPRRRFSGSAPRPARVGGDDAPVKTVKRDEPKIGRNDPCWCGTGKKFKKCHGAA